MNSTYYKMQAKEKKDFELLLSMLEKEQLCEFIREECTYDKGVLQRFLALGAGILYAPKATDYVSRIHDIIEIFSGRSGYVEYYQGFDFNSAVCHILYEVNAAMSSQKWEVAIAILEGVAIAGEDIMYCGDDSGGELSSIVDECFEKWQELCGNELLPPKIKSKIFELSITYFMEECLGGWDWWWSWIEIAISVSDTAEQRERLINVLDDVINEQGAKWSDEYKRNKAKRYKLEVMSKSGTPEEQRKFMYDNVGVPEFRERLLQIAWDEGNYTEVLRLAQDGVIQDSKFAGLVMDWRKWELKTYRHNNDNEKTAELSRYFFFHEGMYGDKEYSCENMYALMKSTVATEKWNDYVDTLIKEAQKKKDKKRTLHIYKQEKMWDRYIEYLKRAPSVYNLDYAPQEVWTLYKDELISLYTLCVRQFFEHASCRNYYCQGVDLLRKLIKHGGRKKANEIIVEQMNRKPRRPALIDELSKL